MKKGNKRRLGKGVYTPMEEEVKKAGIYKFPHTDEYWLEWDEENDGIVFRAKNTKNLDITKNYAVKNLKEKRSISPEDKTPEPPKQEPKEDIRECYIDLGEGLVKWDGKEYWKQIEGYDNRYMVSTFGRVWNKLLGREIAASKDSQKYLKVNFYYGNSKKKSLYVHRLVAQAFIPNENNLPQINHIDEIKTNCRVDNLEFCSAQYNSQYSQYKREREVEQYDLKTNETIKTFKSVNDAERLLGFSKGCISKACRGVFKSYKGYGWRFTKAYDPLNHKRREVEQYDLKSGKVIMGYSSSIDAARNLDLGDTNLNTASYAIRRCCKNEMLSYKGYGWRYKAA